MNTKPELIRVNRFLSMCGVTSRRKGDDLIRAGRVLVNGKVVTDLGTKVDPSADRVFLDGQEITRVHEHEYLLFNKPKDTITTLRDEKGRKSVMDYVRTKERVFPVGRLDRNTTGVLLLTSDGDFAHRLMHPKFNMPKTYQVRCESAVTPRDLERLRKGIMLGDGRAKAISITAVRGGKGKEINLTIHDGRNKQVRRMFEALGYTVKGLDRIAYGPVTYDGLSRGSLRKLKPGEITELDRWAGGNNGDSKGRREQSGHDRKGDNRE